MRVRLVLVDDDGTVRVLDAHEGGHSMGGPGPDFRALLARVLAGVELSEREAEEVEYLRGREVPCSIWPHARHDGCPGVAGLPG